MLRNRRIISPLLLIMVLFVCSSICQGCWWEETKEQPVLREAPSLKEGPALVAPALMKKNVIDEEKLKKQLEFVHPVIPPGKQSRYQLYITPHDPSVEALAGRINGIRDAYREAVQWIWVSDQVLHGESENWLMPHPFFM